MAVLRTPEEKKRIVECCIDAEMAGESVLDFLTREGYATPRATWVNMQKKYLGRTPDKQTDGKATGKKRKGKRPQIRQDALEQDKLEYEIAKEREKDEKAAEPQPVTTCCAPSTRTGVQVPDKLPEEPVMFTPVALNSRIGSWHMISKEIVMFIHNDDAEENSNSVCMSISDWLEMIREFTPACKAMRVL